MPSVVITETTATPGSTILNNLKTCIIGGHAKLFRYSNSSEKSFLGEYDRTADTQYSYPNLPTNSIVDQDYVKLYGDSVLLNYLSESTYIWQPVLGYTNRVRGTNIGRLKKVVWRDVTYDRWSILYDRDVQEGDIVDIRGLIDGEQYTQRTKVKSLIGDVEPADADLLSSPADPGTVDSCISNQIAGPINCVNLECVPDTYAGYKYGFVSDVYRIEVIDDSGTLKLNISSNNGDNAIIVAPPIDTVFNIGSHGLQGRFVYDPCFSSLLSSTSSPSSSICPCQIDEPYGELIEGQLWEINVEVEAVVPTVALGGSYTGASDRRYLVTVTKGDLLSDTPQITVYTVDGTDSSGPFDVTALPTTIDVGSYGIELTLSGVSVDKLVKNWVWQIDAWAEEEGPDVFTIELEDDLIQPLQTPDNNELFIKLHLPPVDAVEIPRKGVVAPNYNFQTADTTVMVYGGIQLYDYRWTDDGSRIPITLYEASLYLEYRAWLSTNSSKVYTLSSTSDLVELDGALHPDNPLKWGLYLALLNSEGTDVSYISVADPSDSDSWLEAFDLLEDENYNLVPLTSDSTILSDLFAWVTVETAAGANRSRSMWITTAIEERNVVEDENNSSNRQKILATLEDDPNTAGTQYTLISVTSGNSRFITHGVKAGDILYYDITTDGWGDTVWSEYIIKEVISESSLLIYEGQATAASGPKKIEIWRAINVDNLKEQLQTAIESYNSQLVKIVWPEAAYFGAYNYSLLTPILAGRKSGVWSHQSLSGLELFGITSFDTCVSLSQTDIEDISNLGVTVLYKRYDDTFAAYKCYTTDTSSISTREESIVTNRHSINRYLYSQVQYLLGTVNINDTTINAVIAAISQGLNDLKMIWNRDLGPQVINGEISGYSTSTDTITVSLSLTLPAPANTVVLQETITIGA